MKRIIAIRSGVRRVGLVGGIVGLAALGDSIAATDGQPGRPAPQIETLDCALPKNKGCAECGGKIGGISVACCFDACKVINRPKPSGRIGPGPTRPANPTAPSPISGELRR